MPAVLFRRAAACGSSRFTASRDPFTIARCVSVSGSHPRRDAVAALPAEPRPPASPSAALRREFGEATDLYAFAERARRRPLEGGLLYAEQAANYCRYANVEHRVHALEEESPPAVRAVDAHRATMLERYARRCAGFQSLDLDAYWKTLHADPGRLADPLVVASGALSRAPAGPARIAAIRAVLDLHDPLLLSSRFVFLVDPDRVDGMPRGLWFDGRDYQHGESASDDDYGLYVDALGLATCEPGSPCDRDDLAILSCRARSICVDSIDDDRFAGDPALDPRARQRYWADVLTLTGRMRDAIGRGDLDAFRAPHSR